MVSDTHGLVLTDNLSRRRCNDSLVVLSIFYFMILAVGDYVIASSRQSRDEDQPVYQIEALDASTSRCIIVDRRGNSLTLLQRDLTRLSSSDHEPILWEELICLEKRIAFITECLDDCTTFGFTRVHGLVKKIEDNKYISVNSPWSVVTYSPKQVETLSQTRLEQLGLRLEKLEASHDFLMNAIESLT